ncbi:hypothetical protein K491DRAFT_594724 [Lophiostoma macrostomum CBS 122681]|uniref:NAD dependent epimerase/dehydratase n=1 Tax=Lophiostoma macrostomum CBS 122681 TaxID=1314788 RepID=A0A6A6TG34_9PLEO|nr:hypothetical protein K491DRAFT_594724 [Lophiostoma macrostomum CBS 122681]
MGNQASTPRPGTSFQVIGAGLPRTGTASFSEALRILLGGPVYHVGTQITVGKPVEIKSWIRILKHWPPRDESDRKVVLGLIRNCLDGYAAATDAPNCICVRELLEIYPDAKVICTVRNPDAWVRSMAILADATNVWFLRAVLFPLPGMRHFVDFLDELRKQYDYLYKEHDPQTTKTYDRHVAWLEKTVPEDRLVFFDVKDGWAPLCEALGKEVPDVPFPRINDGEAIDRLSKAVVKRGLLRWLFISATLGVVFTALCMLTDLECSMEHRIDQSH